MTALKYKQLFNPGKRETSQDKYLEGLTSFAIWWLLQVLNFKDVSKFLVIYDRLSGVRY